VTPEAAERRSDPIGVAVVGLGYWGPNLARVIQELPDAELAVLCDSSTAALEKVGRRYPGADRVESFARVLEHPGVDAVAIATPVGSHYELAAAALEADKHVFVEKPMAGSLTEAEALLALAVDRRLTLMPGHTFLYSPPVNAVRDLIKSGELGDIYFISTSRVNLGLHQSDASVIRDLGPHDFSILQYWLDQAPVQVSAITRSCIMPGIPDVAFVNAQYAAGTIAHVELSWLAPSKLRRTVVVGSLKMVVYDDTSGEPVRIHDSSASLEDPATFGEYRLTYRTGPIVSPPIGAAEPLALELGDFCRAIREEDVPRSSARVGVDVIRMIEAVERSISSDGSSIDLLEQERPYVGQGAYR
jgi:predicted dehydrogenase